MKIWKQDFTLERLNELCRNTMAEHLGIEFTESGDNFLKAKMPVDSRTVQPMRLLHGGASVALAETLGSVASWLCLPDVRKEAAVGLEINANHLRPVLKGYVHGTVSAVRTGKKIHVWNIEIRDDNDKLNCVSRITVAIIPAETK